MRNGFYDFKVGKDKSHSCGDVWHQSWRIVVWIHLCSVHRSSCFSKGVEACVDCVWCGCWGVIFNKYVFAYGTPRPCQDGVKRLKYWLSLVSGSILSTSGINFKNNLQERFLVCFAYFFILSSKIINLRMHTC